MQPQLLEGRLWLRPLRQRRQRLALALLWLFDLRWAAVLEEGRQDGHRWEVGL